MKCPICLTEELFHNSTSLFRHLMDKHTDHEVSSYLVELIEKIQFLLKKWKRKKTILYPDENDDLIEVLESLLPSTSGDNQK